MLPLPQGLFQRSLSPRSLSPHASSPHAPSPHAPSAHAQAPSAHMLPSAHAPSPAPVLSACTRHAPCKHHAFSSLARPNPPHPSAPDRRCYCSAWFPWQHLCPRRQMRIVTSRRPTSTPPARRATRRATRQASPEDRPPCHPCRRRPQCRPRPRRRSRRPRRRCPHPPGCRQPHRRRQFQQLTRRASSPMLSIPRTGMTARRPFKLRAVAM